MSGFENDTVPDKIARRAIWDVTMAMRSLSAIERDVLISRRVNCERESKIAVRLGMSSLQVQEIEKRAERLVFWAVRSFNKGAASTE